MPNASYEKFRSQGQAKRHKSPPIPSGKEGTAAWAGVPGKTQSRNRSGGTKKLRQSPKEVGI